MNMWLIAAAVTLLALIPVGIVAFRGDAVDRLVGLEAAGAIATIEMMLLAEGMHRAPFFDLPLTLALLAFAGGMVFARFLERWM